MSEQTPAPLPRSDDTASAFGYRQELERSLRSFASFAAGFSYLSVLTGTFQLFWLGFQAGGPAFFWTWPLVLGGQMLVALNFAELAAHYPLAGSVYQWSKYTSSWAVGWLTGWVYLASYIVSLPAVALALKVTLPQVAPWSILHKDANWNAVLLGCLLIGLTTLINAVGVRLMARINNIGVFTELIGATLLVVLLALHIQRGPEVVLDTQGHGAGVDYLPAFLTAAMMASYVMYGYDTAGALAEETVTPRRHVPRAILRALGACGILGALLLLCALMAAPNLAEPKLKKDDGGLPDLVNAALGTELGSVFLWNVVIAITVCALAVHTGAVRLMFAMARDNNLPFSRTLAQVSGSARAPPVPALVVGILAIVFLVLHVESEKLMDAIVAVAIVWANLAYLMVTAPLLLRRLRGWPKQGGCGVPGVFSLGRWGLAVNLLAVLFSAGLIVNMAWPRPDSDETPWYESGAALLFTCLLLGAGGLYYGLVQRHKTGVLEEHRAR
jgi:urea carboxylase system permease